MQISIIIPNYNGKELLEENLLRVWERVKKEYLGKVELIVVDDGSTDQSLEFLYDFSRKTKDKNLIFKILKNDMNLGFPKTVNKAVAYSTGKILILFNTDVYPEQGFLKPLLSHFQKQDIFAVGCLDKSVEGGGIVMRGRGIGRWEKGFLIHAAGDVRKTSTLWVNGGSGAFSKKIWERLGGFNELFSPFYWEDIDLSYRALKSGYKVLFEQKSIVFHEHEKGSIQQTYSPGYVKTIAYRNQFIFTWKNTTDPDIILSHIIWLPYHFFSAFIRKDMSFYKGFVMAFFCIFTIVKDRNLQKKYFKKSDKEVVVVE